jgi:hypothetical protein
MSATDAAAAFPYVVHLDVKFDALDLIDVPSLWRRVPTNGTIRRFAR